MAQSCSKDGRAKKPKDDTTGKMDKKKTKSRPWKTWEEGIAEDAIELRIRNWKRAAADRDEWKQKLFEAMARFGAEAHSSSNSISTSLDKSILLTTVVKHEPSEKDLKCQQWSKGA